MGGGASVPDEIKPQIHSAFNLEPSKEWAEGTDCKTEDELRKELVRLRQLAMAVLNVKHDNRVVVDKLDISTYKHKKIVKPPNVEALITAAMHSNILFKRCKEDDLEELLDNFEEVTFKAGETIMKQGDKGFTFYVVETGQCQVFIEGNEDPVAEPRAGQSFGELALMYNTPRAATIKCATDVKCWFIKREEYRLVLAHRARERCINYKAILSEVELVSSKGHKKLLKDALSDDDVSKLADAMDEDFCPSGMNIITEGEEGHTFYIVLEGKVTVTKGGAVVATLDKGKYFGEKALVSDEKRAATCTAADGGAKVLAVDREDFVTLLGSIDELVEAAPLVEKPAFVPQKRATKLVAQDLSVLRTLGQGAFGRVRLCKNNASGDHYALKQQSKSAIVENNLEEHVMMERDILLSLDHPFILKLVSSFQDKKYIYFVLELLIGGELFTYLRKLRMFPEQTMKFFVAGVILGFEHMHAKKIAYRDLKPENLVLDHDGYCKIVDLGLAKVVQSKTWTLCGTPDYLAPEIILNEGHDKAVDYWALGVLMFELVAGMPPFYSDDPMASYEKILSGQLKFPSHFRKYLSDCIRKLLKLCQSKRLGNGKGGCVAIKKHRFFAGFLWDELVAKNKEKLPPPIEVSVKDMGDASNFDVYDEEKDDAKSVDWAPSDIPMIDIVLRPSGK